MKTSQSKGTCSPHQPVASKLRFKAEGKSIAIGFTDQRLSSHAGAATFWAWLRPLQWRELLAVTMQLV